ncbi:probable cation-transporting ATPase 13A4 isoform X2 [Panulirus ornatus]|uniref:probable cation-transporting ATPase 13A4 isoform X2 n=1 Tax=Panulirus ornatus TaxID=150431 RepID=UPI003A856C26
MWGTKATADRLNLGTRDELEATGYTRDPLKMVLTAVATLLTGGLLLLLIAWRPSIKLALTHRRCSLHDAQRLLLKDIYHQLWEEEVVREERKEDAPGLLYFFNKKIKYVWDDATCTFVRLRLMEEGTTFSTFHKGKDGLTGDEASDRLVLYGENFMKIEVASIWQLLIQQAISPFYLLQAFCVGIWFAKTYFYMGVGVLVKFLGTVFFFVYKTRKQSISFRKTVTSQSDVAVLRNGQRTVLSSRDVVPGDVVLIGNYLDRLEMDAVLLQGSVITNEAMLTGESVPVTKIGVPRGSDTMFVEEEHKHHLLYSGSQVLQVRGATELPAFVLNTGFDTARGELVRSILFPKPIDFHFYNDFMKMLVVFLLLGLAAMCWSLVQWMRAKANWNIILYNSLDLMTFVVPPVLPATVTAINVWTQQRLKRQDIYSLSSNYISLSGSVDVVCFDKTGTLTEDDLTLAGVVPCEKGDLKAPQEDLTHLPPDQPLTKALASCHSLTYSNNRLVGYPLDVKIFTGIDWTLEEPPAGVNPDYGLVTPVLVKPSSREGVDPNQHEMAVLKTFPFESREQRMTVVTRGRNTNTTTAAPLEIFIKGAPEKITSLCNPNTVPGIAVAAQEWYTRQGLRVLAVAGRTHREDFTWDQVEASTREKLEEGAMFLGLVLLQNKLKVETAPVVSMLQRANITTVMVTGDNLLTALSVARQSGLVEAGHQLIVVKARLEGASSAITQNLKVIFYDADYEARPQDKRKMTSLRNENYVLAMNGDTFDLLANGHDKVLFKRLIHKSRVFARMKPDQKITVVEALQDLGHHVAMCGDGCNDCGALKVADTGISLSSAEASVAAPFTSKQKNIGCVPTLIREGRATLVSIFTAFKYNVVSCFGALICVLFHYSIQTEPTDVQYVIQDLLLFTVPALAMGNTGAPPYLAPTPPARRILSFLPTASIFSLLAWHAVVYWIILTYLRAQSWFEPFVYDYEWKPIPCYENTALIMINFYFFIIGAFIYSHGAPYRKSIYTNYILSGYLLAALAFCIFVNFYTGTWFEDLMNFIRFPHDGFSGVLFFVACISFVVSFMWERWLLYGVIQQYVLPWFQAKCGPRAPYAKVEADLQSERDWPPLSDPPVTDMQRGSSTGELLEEVQTELVDEEYTDDMMLLRKLTRRHHFKASVKYLPGKPESDSSVRTADGFTNIDMALTNSQHLRQPDHQHQMGRNVFAPVYSPPPDSAGYREPWDAVQDEGGVFGFNHNVQHQIMKRTGGAFRTFKGSIKRQNALDKSAAQPYEVISLSDHRQFEQTEDIYATISEVPSCDNEGTESTVTTHVITSQEQEGWQDSRKDNNEGRVISAGSTSRPVSTAEEQYLKEQLYDVPKPPKPVEIPYLPVTSDGKSSSSFPQVEPHLSSAMDMKTYESSC